jgi:hypothetical protein
MKKYIIILFGLTLSVSLRGQTFVSTEPSNKNVLLEEYTGVNCVWCPAGHKIANELMRDNPGRLLPINIHQGHLANTIPDFRTDFGDALASQAGVNGYPMGTVNRHIFSGLKTAMDRTQWSDAAAEIMSQSSYVNIAAKSVIDVGLRLLTVNVEIYYTADAPVEVNNLNVALLQDDILGPQTGMGANPEQVVGNKYNHQHMLRDLITGQWGDEITTVTEGSFISKTYTYEVPMHLRNVDIELRDLDVIVFITEGHQEIITAAKSEMQITNGKPIMESFKEFETFSCDAQVLLYATVFNFTNEDITSLQFDYKIDDGPLNTYTWEDKTIAPLATDTVYFAFIPVVSEETYKITAILTGYNGEEIVDGTPLETTVNKNIVDVKGDKFAFILTTDRYAKQTSFAFFDSNGNIIKKDGPFDNLTFNGTTLRQYVFEPPTSGCYKLEVYDTAGNGINSGNGEGYIKLMDLDENVIFYNDGKFGYQANCHINVTKLTSTDKNILNDNVNIYPNPVKDILHIDTDGNIKSIEIVNTQGQRVIFTNKSEINVSELLSGIYFVSITTKYGLLIKKFIKY